MYAILVTIALLLTPLRTDPPAQAPAAASRPSEGRILRHSGVVNASPDAVWKVFTTEEGWTTAVGVAKCAIDLRVGGTIRSVYDKNATIGDESTITNTILAYEPERMIALKATAPKNAPEFIKAACETGWSVIRFDPIAGAPDRTMLTITGMGYRDSDLHKQAYEFFDKGNAWTLKKIQDHFASPAQAKAADDAEKLMFRMTGKWTFSSDRPDGTTFSGETNGTLLFNGKVLVADGFLTIGSNTFHHSHFIAARDPQTGTMRAWSFNQDGDVTEGQIRAEAPEKLVVDWQTFQRSDGRFVDYRVEYTFNGPDVFRCVVLSAPEADGTRRTLVDVTYKRTADAPE